MTPENPKQLPLHRLYLYDSIFLKINLDTFTICVRCSMFILSTVKGQDSMKKTTVMSNTKNKLKQALIDLSETIPFPEITVKDLCQKAGLSRSTFYVYYSNTREILDELQLETIAEAYMDRIYQPDKAHIDGMKYALEHRSKLKLLMDYGSMTDYLSTRTLIHIKNSLEEKGCQTSNLSPLVNAISVWANAGLIAASDYLYRNKETCCEKNTLALLDIFISIARDPFAIKELLTFVQNLDEK